VPAETAEGEGAIVPQDATKQLDWNKQTTRNPPMSNTTRAQGMPRCCKNGMFGEEHDCQKQPGVPPATGPEYPTLRDQFAMAALTGLLASGAAAEPRLGPEIYRLADAMLEARKR
jgi:hypothetical protein